MAKLLKRLRTGVPNLLFGHAFHKDISRHLDKLNKQMPRDADPRAEQIGICRINFDDYRGLYTSPSKVRRIACEKAGYDLNKGLPGILVP